jgi:hypothetical protein
MDSSNQNVYIFCPANRETGGPEALHQLRYYMEQVNLKAFLVYFNALVDVDPTPDRYRIYKPKTKNIEEVIDEESNIVIVPESNISLLIDFKRMRKCIWWLSVSFYEYLPQKRSLNIKKNIKILLGKREKEVREIQFPIKDCLNLCASKYTYEFLKEQKVKESKFLVEPISKQFLDWEKSEDFERDSVILYNPSKPSEIMTRLLECDEFKFKPIKGYSPYELIEVYRKAKLYIDFGDFGGPERIPKEAVYFGCNILVGKRNASKNDFDVAIPDNYKIKKYNELDLVKNRIREILDNYESDKSDFDPFREKIKNLELNFMKQIQEIFIN